MTPYQCILFLLQGNMGMTNPVPMAAAPDVAGVQHAGMPGAMGMHQAQAPAGVPPQMGMQPPGMPMSAAMHQQPGMPAPYGMQPSMGMQQPGGMVGMQQGPGPLQVCELAAFVTPSNVQLAGRAQ